MEIKNLDCNILDMLGDNWLRSGARGPYGLDRIYAAFSDIPKENITSAVQSLLDRSLVTEHARGRSLFLTRAGIARFEALRSCLNGFPERLHRNVSGCCA